MPHRDHIRILDNDVWEGNENTFKVGQHRASYLAEKVVQFSRFRGRHLSPLQQAALTEYREDKIYSIRSTISGADDRKVLAAYFNLLDNLFFFGSLRPHCELYVHIQPASETGINGHCATRMHWKACFGKPWHKRNTITLFARHNETSRRSERLLMYISTLLHEMIHAFLNLWSCDQEQCHRKMENEGESGHGVAWQDIAFALENASRERQLVGLDLYLNREVSLALELKESGSKMTRNQLRRWDMDCDHVAGELRRLKI